MLTVEKLWNWNHCHLDGARGRCELYSRASRWRLLQTFAKVNWDAHCGILLITLTYPDSVGQVVYEKRTTQRNLFFARLERYLGQPCACVWRTEHKVRKSGALKGQLMPHIHILAFTPAYVPWQEIRRFWGEVLEYEGPLATDVRRIRGPRRAAAYAAKYAAKAADTSFNIAAYLGAGMGGRPWGIRRRKLITEHERIDLGELSEEEAHRVGQLLHAAGGAEHPYMGGSYTALGRLAELGYDAITGRLDTGRGRE